ncbi:LOW QUALITY PROTEIN: lipocalin-like [Rhinophrynus dorsalis]
MKGLVLTLALVTVCALCAQAEVPIQPDFQDGKIVGKWYSIGLASNSNWFQDKKQQLKMCSTVITPSADGNLEVVATYPKMDRCENKTMTYIKTKQPGLFRSKSPRYGSDHEIRVVETNYEEYTLMFTLKTKGNEVNTIVSLFCPITAGELLGANSKDKSVLGPGSRLLRTILTQVFPALSGRTKNLRPELLQKFDSFAKEQGLTEDQILILPQTDKGPECSIIQVI